MVENRSCRIYIELSHSPARDLCGSSKDFWELLTCRCYIPKMADMAAPLYKLTEKGSKWMWTPECELAFATLRDRLTSEPVVLAFLQWNKSFYVEVVASATGVGAVLSQNDTATNKLRPICYYSSSLSPSQKSYSAGQLEA